MLMCHFDCARRVEAYGPLIRLCPGPVCLTVRREAGTGTGPYSAGLMAGSAPPGNSRASLRSSLRGWPRPSAGARGALTCSATGWLAGWLTH